MPSNLTPEQLAWLRQNQMGYGNQTHQGTTLSPDGMSIYSNYGSGGGGGEAGWDTAPSLDSYTQDINGGDLSEGDLINAYGADGKFNGQSKYHKSGMFEELAPIAAVLAMPFAASALGIGAAGTGAGVGGAATTGTAFGGAGMSSADLAALYGSAGYGEGMAGLTAAELGGGATGAAGLSSAGGGGVLSGIEGSSAGMVAPAASNAAFDSAVAGSSGLLSGAAKYLPALAGALAGGFSSPTGGAGGGGDRKMDPRMDQYVYGGDGQTGLLGYTKSLLDKQMAPGYMAGYDKMRDVGQGLLGTPQMGNGFNKFFPGKM